MIRNRQILFCIIAVVGLLFAPGLLFAQEPADSVEPESSEPEASEPVQLTGTLEQQIQQLSTQITDLQAEVDELVFAKETYKRDRLKRQVAALKRQLKQLLVQKQLATRSSMQMGEQKIREGYADRIRAIEQQKAVTRLHTIHEFEALLERDTTSQSRANIIFRLGLLYFEDDHYQYQCRQEEYLQSVGQLVEQGGDFSVGDEPMPNYHRAQIRFLQVVNEYPNFTRADFAHYMLAYCMTEHGDLTGAIKVYRDLIQKFPTSEYVPESHIRMGELLFDENKMEEAITQYNEVLNHPNSKFYDKALFKLGWSYYRMTTSDSEELQMAVEYFTRVLDYYQNRPKASLRGGDDLRQESVDYIAISFTDMDERGFSQAKIFVDQHPEYKWNKDILSKMADVYFERDKYDEAKLLVEERVRRWPNDPDNPRVHLKIVDAMVTLGLYEEAIAVGEEIAALYGPGTEWAKANQGRDAVINSAQKQRAKLLFASATYHHEKAQKSKSEEGMDAARGPFKKAAVSYEQYLTSFPDAKDSYEATFNLAEVLFELQDYEMAGTYYQKVVDRKKDKELFTHAIKNLVYSREQQFQANPGWPVKPPDKIEVSSTGQGDRADIQKVPMSPQAENWIVAMNQHVTELPDDPDNARVLFKIGEVYYYHGHFDESVDTFRNQIARYPNSEAAQVSMNLVIQALDREGRYEELQTVAADYRNRVKVEVLDSETNMTNVDMLDKIQVGAAAKIAEQKIKEGKLQEGVNEYLALANRNPKSEQAPIALHNAAATYVELGNVYEANELYLRIARDYPSFKQSKKNLFFAATQYEKLIEFDRAVNTYTLYVESYPDDELAKDALYNAALLRENNKEYQRAIVLYQDYLYRYPNTPDAAEIAYSIANIQLESGNDPGAEMAFERFTKTYTDAVLLTKAYLEWGKLSKKRGSFSEAIRHFKQAAAVYVQASQIDPKAGAAYAAEAKFELAEIDFDQFSQIQLDNPSNMEKALVAKANAYKALNMKYMEIVQLGNFEFATAALYMIGKINKDFAETLFSAPVPEELDVEQQDLYIVKLEEMAFPLKKKSIDAFETNIQKGIQEQTRNQWIDKSYDEIRSYKPELSEAKYELYRSDSAPSLPAPSFQQVGGGS